MGESDSARAAQGGAADDPNDPNGACGGRAWWVWREAALLALSIGAEQLCAAYRRALRKGAPPPLDIAAMLGESGCVPTAS